MIHSMSGGILANNEALLFAKVDVGGTPRWYLAPFSVSAGEKVLAPFEGTLREATVIRTELCTNQTAPIPVKRALSLEKP